MACGLLIAGCMPSQDQSQGKTKAKIDLETVNINNEYSMGIPKFMSEAKSLNDEASLQYQNIFQEAYVIVIDESKDEYIESYKNLDAYDTTQSVIANYTDTQIQSITSRLEVIEKSEVKTFRINGLNASSIEIDGKVENVDVPITYFLNFVEGREKLYFIMAWTLQKKKDTHRSTFEEMVKSFRVFKRK